MEKKEARQEVRRRLERLTASERAARSARALARLVALDEYRSARTVLLFASLPDELDTLPIIRRALADGKRVALPRSDAPARQLRLCPVADMERDLAPGTYGILEPTGSGAVPRGEIDFALIPARAYDEHGNRLGRGAGFYDRLLADPSFRAARCGLAYEEQMLADLPHDPHDQAVQIVVTDRKLRRL